MFSNYPCIGLVTFAFKDEDAETQTGKITSSTLLNKYRAKYWTQNYVAENSKFLTLLARVHSLKEI